MEIRCATNILIAEFDTDGPLLITHGKCPRDGHHWSPITEWTGDRGIGVDEWLTIIPISRPKRQEIRVRSRILESHGENSCLRTSNCSRERHIRHDRLVPESEWDEMQFLLQRT